MLSQVSKMSDIEFAGQINRILKKRILKAKEILTTLISLPPCIFTGGS